jgi:antibiotic biosynthesis monooxygenase (ABM) superfamily enzyme
MAILLAATVFLLTQFLAPLLEDLLMVFPLPTLLRDFLIVCIQVSLITYLILPTLTHLLSPWLFGQPKNREN